MKKDNNAAVELVDAPLDNLAITKFEPDKRAVAEIKSRLDSGDMGSIANFGMEMQKKAKDTTARTSEVMKLSANHQVVSSSDLGSLVQTLRENDVNKLLNNGKNKGIFGFIKDTWQKTVWSVQDNFQTLEGQINEVGAALESNISTLKNSNTTLKKSYDDSLEYYIEMGNYIEAGKQKLSELQEKLDEIERVDKISLTEENAYLLALEESSLQKYYTSLERKLHSLMNSRYFVGSQLPKLEAMQQVNLAIMEKIHDTIYVSVPSWVMAAAMQLELMKQQNTLEVLDNTAEVTKNFLEANDKMFVENAKKTQELLEKPNISSVDLQRSYELMVKTQQEVREIQQKGALLRKEEMEITENMMRTLTHSLTVREKVRQLTSGQESR